MRISLIIKLVLICSLSAQSQEKVREEIRHEKNDEGDLLPVRRTVYKYNGEQFEEEVSYVREDNAWTLRSVDRYWYNPASLVVRHTSRIYNKNGLFLESDIGISYLDDTLELKSNYIRRVYDEQNSVFESATENTYTADRKIQSAAYWIRESPEAPLNGHRTFNEYNEQGCLSKVAFAVWQNEDWQDYGGIRYIYDQGCRRTRELRYTLENGTETETNGLLYTYQTAGNISSMTRFFRRNPQQAWQFDLEEITRVNGDSTIRIRTNNEQTFEVRRTTILVNNLKTEEFSEISYEDQDEFILTSRSAFRYENERLVEIRFDEWSADEENALTRYGVVNYEYDDQGNILAYTSNSMQNGLAAYYSEKTGYRCDGVKSEVRVTTRNQNADEENLTTFSYYSDPPCDGADFEQNLLVYPNPARNEIWIYSGTGLDEQTIEILDRSGRIVERRQPEGLSYDNLDISRLVPGLYILRVRGSDNEASVRFIKTD